MRDPVKMALMDVWRSLYEIQVRVIAMDPDLLPEIDSHLVQLQYRLSVAKRVAKPHAPRRHFRA